MRKLEALCENVLDFEENLMETYQEKFDEKQGRSE